MTSKHNFIRILGALLVLQSVAARTVLHRRTEIDSNGEQHTKTWRTEEPDEDFPTPSQDAAGDEDFQTFTRNGVTLRIKPQVTTLRIGGKHTTPEQLLEQAKHAKELELIAVRQLLSTGHPVKRTNIENGRKHTSTYTLESDGSIVVRKVEEIDRADVERRFEEIFKQRAQKNPNKLSEWEWAESKEQNDELPVEHESKAEQQPSQANKPKQATPIPASSAAAPTPTPKSPQTQQPQQSPQKPQPVEPQQPWVSSNNFFTAPSSFSRYPQLPRTWDRDSWSSNEDPFNPPELPAYGGFNDEFEPIVENAVPDVQRNTYTSTQTDKDGNTVHTTYTSGPNEWKRKTVKISSTNNQPTETTEESTTIKTKNLPPLNDFLRSQYNPNKDDRPPTTIWTTATTPKTLKTINIEDLPPVAVVNLDKPIEEQFLHPLGPNAGVPTKPIKTLHVENISPTPDFAPVERVESTKIRTFTKTVPGNHAPSSADLDPNMLDILHRAGINPEEITNVNGQAITKTRVEPDGRIVTTTYRVRPTFGTASAQPSFTAPFPHHSPFGARSPYGRPSIFSEPPAHQSGSHFGVDFTPFGEAPAEEAKPASTPKTKVRDREPLGPVDEDEEEETEAEEEEAATLNPLLIHPVHAAPTTHTNVVPTKARYFKSAITEFLAKIGLSVDDLSAQNGEFVKTIVDEDGRMLMAKFVLSPPFGSKYDK